MATSTHLGLLVCLIPLAGFPFLNPEEVESAEIGMSSSHLIWRNPENDGANCLYVQLRLLGLHASYEEFQLKVRRHLPLRTLTEIKLAAKDCGIHLLPAQLTMQELQDARLPVLCHLEPIGGRPGRFVLWVGLMGAAGSDGVLFDGGPGTLCREDIDVFRREWSGVALVPSADLLDNTRISSLFIVVFIVCLCTFLRITIRTTQVRARERLVGTGVHK